MDAESIERVYSAFSGVYDLIFGRWFHQSRADALQLLNISGGEKILEVGVGTGLSLNFYPKNCQVTGIDFCEPMLEKAKRRLRQYQLPHIELMNMDAMKMAFPDNTFDAIFAAYVISTVPDPHQVISEMIRVCKVGGKIILLNHFKNGNRLISTCEKVISPFTRKIGFRSDLDLGTLLNGKPLAVDIKQNVKPLNYWKVVQLTNQKNGNGTGNGHGNGNGVYPQSYTASKKK